MSKEENTHESCYLTVGELLDNIKEYNIPRDGKVFYQRIEDVYFKKHGWTTKSKRGLIHKDQYDRFIRAFCIIKYKDDKDLYITAHY